MPAMPTLVALIGPVEPDLLVAWVHHYRALGIDRFRLGFHFPDHVTPEHRARLQDTSRSLGIAPATVSEGPWHEHTNPQAVEVLRGLAGDGWHLLADSDEFHTYPAPLDQVLRDAEAGGTGTVGGLLLDRVAADGSLTGWNPGTGLDAVYPLGGFVTHRLLRGDPRKIVLAHHSVTVASGNHRAPGHRPTNRPPVLVHHFKWRAGVREDLQRRVAHSADGTWQTSSPAIPTEATRLLNHLDQHAGRLNVHSPDLHLRPVTLTVQPVWWTGESTTLVDGWRPPTCQDQSGATISSPSP
ncbi:hypothetical protein [Streptomyces sp. NPDC101455]|uniref:hypothetical protein n=1 Tax=Streptomyces sp. NPDC101455 TaxID=3366142 RepID=UPI0038082288